MFVWRADVGRAISENMCGGARCVRRERHCAHCAMAVHAIVLRATDVFVVAVVPCCLAHDLRISCVLQSESHSHFMRLPDLRHTCKQRCVGVPSASHPRSIHLRSLHGSSTLYPRSIRFRTGEHMWMDRRWNVLMLSVSNENQYLG